MTDPQPTDPASPAQLGDELLSFDVARLAAGVRVQLRCAGGFTEPLSLAEAAVERGVSIASLQASFDALCGLCQRSPTRVFARVPAAQVAQAAGISVARVNRAVPLLNAFGLIVRRPRHRGAHETTIPALVAAAAAPEGSLDALWAQPAVEPGPPQWRIPAAVADAAAWVRIPDVAFEPQPPRSCPCRPQCALGAVVEQLVKVIGPQARDRSWQDDLHAALDAGYSPQFILWELTRDMHDARAPGGVARHRVDALIGRARRRSRHACSEASQHAVAVSWHHQAVAALGEHHAASGTPRLAQRTETAVERTGFVRERDHMLRRQAETAKATTHAAPPGPSGESRTSRSEDPRPAHRETSRKVINTSNYRLSPPQTPPASPGGGTAETDTDPQHLQAAAILDEAVTITNAALPHPARRRIEALLADQFPSVSERNRLIGVLGLVTGTQSARSAVRVLAYRAANPGEARRYAAPMVSLVDAGQGGTIRDPAAWEAASNHLSRIHDAGTARAAESQRRGAELAAGGEAERRSAVVDSQAEADLRAAADDELAAASVAGAEALLARRLHPAVRGLASFSASAALLLVVRRAGRLVGRIEGAEVEIAALLWATRRWENLDAELAGLGSVASGPAAALRSGLAQLGVTSGPRPTSLLPAAASGGDDDLLALMGQPDMSGISRADVDAAVTALGSNSRATAEVKRDTAAWLLRVRQSATDSL